MITFGAILYNEEKFIRGLLNNIKPYCNELIIIDQESTDKTIEYVKASSKTDGWGNDLILKQTTNKKYADPDRTLLLSLPDKNNWIFMIDADERLCDNIPFDDLIEMGYDGVNLPMKSLYFEEDSGYEDWDYNTLIEKGQEVNEGYPDWHIRLLRKGTIWPEKIHGQGIVKKQYNAPEYNMLHIKTYEKQLEKARRYATLYPDTVQFHNNYITYIQKQLGKEVKGL